MEQKQRNEPASENLCQRRTPVVIWPFSPRSPLNPARPIRPIESPRTQYVPVILPPTGTAQSKYVLCMDSPLEYHRTQYVPVILPPTGTAQNASRRSLMGIPAPNPQYIPSSIGYNSSQRIAPTVIHVGDPTAPAIATRHPAVSNIPSRSIERPNYARSSIPSSYHASSSSAEKPNYARPSIPSSYHASSRSTERSNYARSSIPSSYHASSSSTERPNYERKRQMNGFKEKTTNAPQNFSSCHAVAASSSYIECLCHAPQTSSFRCQAFTASSSSIDWRSYDLNIQEPAQTYGTMEGYTSEKMPRKKKSKSGQRKNMPSKAGNPTFVKDNPASVIENPASILDDPHCVAENSAMLVESPGNLVYNPVIVENLVDKRIDDSPASVLENTTSIIENPQPVPENPACVVNNPHTLQENSLIFLDIRVCLERLVGISIGDVVIVKPPPRKRGRPRKVVPPIDEGAISQSKPAPKRRKSKTSEKMPPKSRSKSKQKKNMPYEGESSEKIPPLRITKPRPRKNKPHKGEASAVKPPPKKRGVRSQSKPAPKRKKGETSQAGPSNLLTTKEREEILEEIRIICGPPPTEIVEKNSERKKKSKPTKTTEVMTPPPLSTTESEKIVEKKSGRRKRSKPTATTDVIPPPPPPPLSTTESERCQNPIERLRNPVPQAKPVYYRNRRKNKGKPYKRVIRLERERADQDDFFQEREYNADNDVSQEGEVNQVVNENLPEGGAGNEGPDDEVVEVPIEEEELELLLPDGPDIYIGVIFHIDEILHMGPYPVVGTAAYPVILDDEDDEYDQVPEARRDNEDVDDDVQIIERDEVCAAKGKDDEISPLSPDEEPVESPHQYYEELECEPQQELMYNESEISFAGSHKQDSMNDEEPRILPRPKPSWWSDMSEDEEKTASESDAGSDGEVNECEEVESSSANRPGKFSATHQPSDEEPDEPVMVVKRPSAKDTIFNDPNVVYDVEEYRFELTEKGRKECYEDYKRTHGLSFVEEEASQEDTSEPNIYEESSMPPQPESIGKQMSPNKPSGNGFAAISDSTLYLTEEPNFYEESPMSPPLESMGEQTSPNRPSVSQDKSKRSDEESDEDLEIIFDAKNDITEKVSDSVYTIEILDSDEENEDLSSIQRNSQEKWDRKMAQNPISDDVKEEDPSIPKKSMIIATFRRGATDEEIVEDFFLKEDMEVFVTELQAYLERLIAENTTIYLVNVEETARLMYQESLDSQNSADSAKATSDDENVEQNMVIPPALQNEHADEGKISGQSMDFTAENVEELVSFLERSEAIENALFPSIEVPESMEELYELESLKWIEDDEANIEELPTKVDTLLEKLLSEDPLHDNTGVFDLGTFLDTPTAAETPASQLYANFPISVNPTTAISASHPEIVWMMPTTVDLTIEFMNESDKEMELSYQIENDESDDEIEVIEIVQPEPKHDSVQQQEQSSSVEKATFDGDDDVSIIE
ncbi:hypothetical protein AVEN_181642-3 [Araneus ventricosus]|uniref:Uncharacterized protein n=1 Tax=Araneus ventricosus TaxID=182803 RepID=A0A4Y2CMU7_ARAVE|nr:hypothetical protein AVEN_181642-3 [Araneus ventricosus]